MQIGETGAGGRVCILLAVHRLSQLKEQRRWGLLKCIRNQRREIIHMPIDL